MAVTARMNYVRVTPRKMQAVCHQIRGKQVGWVIDFLTHCRKQAAQPLLKLVRSAVANADRKGGVDVDRLSVGTLLCDHGVRLKRWLPRARGMATPILKRTCHVTLVLEEK